MFENSIDEKIKKIRQDLYGFNIAQNESFEKYLEGHDHLKDCDPEDQFYMVFPEENVLKSSQSAKDLALLDDFDSFSRPGKRNFDSTANYQEFTLSNENKQISSMKKSELAVKVQELSSSLDEHKEKYMRLINEKNDKKKRLYQYIKK